MYRQHTGANMIQSTLCNKTKQCVALFLFLCVFIMFASAAVLAMRDECYCDNKISCCEAISCCDTDIACCNGCTQEYHEYTAICSFCEGYIKHTAAEYATSLTDNTYTNLSNAYSCRICVNPNIIYTSSPIQNNTRMNN